MATASDRSTPILVVCLPRSGSTFVTNILTASGSVLRIGELHYLDPWRSDFRTFLRRHGRGLADPSGVSGMVDSLLADELPRELRRGEWGWLPIRSLAATTDLRARLIEAIEGSDRSIGAIFRVIIDTTTASSASERAIVKSPVFPTYVEQLREWYPEAKIIHLTRDPRAIAMSKTSDPGGSRRLQEQYPRLRRFIPWLAKYFVVVQYVLSSRAHARVGETNNYLLLRYEDLLAEPERVVKELCAFTGLDYDDTMLSPSEGQASSLTGEKRGGIDRSAAERWREAMSPLEASIMTALTRRSMARYGYEFDGSAPPARWA